MSAIERLKHKATYLADVDDYADCVDKRDLRKLIAAHEARGELIKTMKEKQPEYTVHCGHLGEICKATCSNYGCRLDAATKAADRAVAELEKA